MPRQENLSPEKKRLDFNNAFLRLGDKFEGFDCEGNEVIDIAEKILYRHSDGTVMAVIGQHSKALCPVEAEATVVSSVRKSPSGKDCELYMATAEGACRPSLMFGRVACSVATS